MSPAPDGPPDRDVEDLLRTRVAALVREHGTDAPDLLGARYDAGLALLHHPVGLGGLGLPATHQARLEELLVEAGVPAPAPYRNPLGIGTAVPTLLAYGSRALQERLFRPAWTGEEIWCQLFSEPGAGSDLAGLSTRAVRDGDEWVVSGQKVWTSAAHYASHGILLVRTDPDQPKHRGITCLVVEMDAPGVEVRPLRQIDGAFHFNEVFLDEVRVPVSQTLGPEGAGWGVALTMLAHERASIGGGGMYGFAEVLTLARNCSDPSDPVVRQRLVDLYTRFELLRFLGYRVRTAAERGELPGPESSVLKLVVSALYETGGSLVVELQGPGGMLVGDDAPFTGKFQDLFMGQWAPRIGGGTDQIQRNIIGERVLGLPGDPRADKHVPFRDLPRS